MSDSCNKDEALLREVHDLVTRCLLADATVEQWARLESLVCHNEEARRTYFEYMCDSHELHLRTRMFEAESTVASTSTDVACARPHSARLIRSVFSAAARLGSRPTPFSITVATIVIGLLITAMAFMAPPFYRTFAHRQGRKDSEMGPAVARIAHMNNARWDRGQSLAGSPSLLRDGHSLVLLRGRAEIAFDTGATAILEGPARCQIEGQNGLYLETGRLTASTPASAKGFSVRTPLGTFVDLGTEFSVDMSSSGMVSMFVRQGQVACVRNEGDEPTVLTAGEGAEIRPSGIITRITDEPPAFAAMRGLSREDLLVNGSFEATESELDTPLPKDDGASGRIGWKSVGKYPVVAKAGTSGVRPIAGERLAQLMGHPHAGSAIEQTFATTPGTQYELRLYVSRTGLPEKSPTLVVEVFSAGKTKESLVHEEEGIDWPPGQWKPMQVWFVADASQSTLRISEPQSSHSYKVAPVIDKVSVIVAPHWRGTTSNDFDERYEQEAPSDKATNN